MKLQKVQFLTLGFVGFCFVIIGNVLSQPELVPYMMTYGNFDIPGRISFVNRLLPGTYDHCSEKIYDFSGPISWHPFIILVGVLFPIVLIWGVVWNNEIRNGIYRVFVQWFCFVLSRIGILRASLIYPIKRSCFGTFPFLNCQACEMASGACPIGMLQNLLIRGIWPFHLVGSMIIFGVVLGKTICGWLCPFGFISDLIDRISLHRWSIPRSLAHIRYVVLIVTIISAILLPSMLIYDRNFFCSTICVSGKILGLIPYYVTTASESFFPISRWLNDILGNGFLIGFHIGLTLIVLVAMLTISGRLFCRVICPLGGFWGLFNSVSIVGVRHKGSKCVGCYKCEVVCPMGVSASFADFADKSSCISCGRCVVVCPSESRFFYWGLYYDDTRKETETSAMVIPHEIGYGSLFNRLRRDFYMIAISLAAKTPLDMARYAYEHTQFYRKLYKSPPEEFNSLPLALKKSLGSIDPYELLSDEMTEKVIYYGETTGSTGFPTPAFYTEREFHAARIFSKITPYVGLLQEALSENRAVLNGLTFGFTIAGMSFADFLLAQGGVVANVGTRSTIATPERTARALTRLRPSIVTGTPIDLLCWMRILKEDYPDKYKEVLEHFRGFISTAELCSASRCKAIEEEFNIKHIDVYACVEGFFSVPCLCGEKHILPAYYAEVFDDNLKLLGTVGEGRFVFTNLIKKSSPMVRYLLDDYVTVFSSNCPYGFKRSIEPHGRYELTVCIGDKRYGVRHFEEEIFKNGLFGDYRIIIEDDLMTFTLEEYGRHESTEKITKALENYFNQKVRVELVPFGTITKYREVRKTKPILKIEDRRSSSTQKIPEYL